MGSVTPRLAKLFSAVRPEAQLGIIITTTRPVDDMLLQALRTAGAGGVRTGAFGTQVFAMANQATAYQLAKVPGVKEVWPDEPTAAL